jgi:hypothetical protein
MSMNFSQVPRYFYDRQKIAREALAEASIPVDKATMVKKHLQNPHKLDKTPVYRRAQSELLLSSHVLSKEHKNISEVHQEMENMTADRPPYCGAGSKRRRINGPSARFRGDWDGLSPEERQERLRATVVRAGHPKEPRPRIILRHPSYERECTAIALREQQEKEKPICDILEKHAKLNGCPTEHSEDKSDRMGAKFCAARAGKVIEDKARNVKLLREVEALQSKAADKGIDTSSLNIKPLSAVPIKARERFNLEKNFAQCPYGD